MKIQTKGGLAHGYFSFCSEYYITLNEVPTTVKGMGYRHDRNELLAVAKIHTLVAYDFLSAEP